MDIQDIITLIQTVSASNLSEFDYQEGETKLSLKIDRGLGKIESPCVTSQSIATSMELCQEKEEECCQVITSPMVGTFYSASSEEAKPFIKVGDVIKKGQIIGIVEAMKLMNEIESPYDGVVEEILVCNREMIGFEQALVRVRPC